MLKRVIQRALQQVGYRLTPVLKDRSPQNPRFDRHDMDVALKVIARHVSHNGGSMTWERSQRYLDVRRVNLYLAVLDQLESAGVLKEGTTVLDVGVYFGYMLRILHRHHPAAIYSGTETNDTRLAIARELCPFASISHGTIDGLPDDAHRGARTLGAS